MNEDDMMYVPEGYFEESFARTIKRSRKIRRNRRLAVGFCASVAVLIISGAGIFHNHLEKKAEKEFIAQQEEIAELDIFLEVN